MDSQRRSFLEPHVIARLGALALHARHPMLGSVAGMHKSPHRGSSVEFAEYRKYVPGDDPRRLDWRAYARTDRFYVKEFEADTNLRLCLVVDTSGSMNYGEKGATKVDHARKMAGALAWIAARQGDAVGLTTASETLRQEIPARRNAAHLRFVLDALGGLEPSGETGLADALHAVAEKNAQRAMVVVFSDLFVEPEGLRRAFQHLRFRRHDVAVFHLLGQDELKLDFERPIRFVDLEGGPAVLADPAQIRLQYEETVASYFESLDQAIKDAVVDYHRVRLDEAYDEVLARFLVGRTPKRARR